MISNDIRASDWQCVISEVICEVAPPPPKIENPIIIITIRLVTTKRQQTTTKRMITITIVYAIWKGEF